MVDRLLINKRYARLWFGGAISIVGDYVFDTTVLLWIATIIAKGKPWAPAAAGGVLVAATVPILLIGPFAGVFVDRWNARRTMLTGDVIRAVLIATLALLALLPHHSLSVPVQLSLVYAVVFLCATVSQFFGPARFSIITDVVPVPEQPKAAGIAQGTGAIAAIVGPPLAAPLLFGAGVQWALFLDAVTFLVSYAAVWGVRTEVVPAAATAPHGFWSEFRDGLRAFLGSRVLVIIVSAALIVNFGAGLLTALDVFFVQVNLHAKASLYGLLGTAFGIGSVAGAILAGAIGQRLGPTRLFGQGLVAAGLGIIVFARTTSFPLALVVFGITAVPVAALNTVVGPIIQRAVPREKLGRVIAFLQPATQLSTLLALGAGSILASTVLRGLNARVLGVHFGTYDAIFVCSGLLIIAGGLYSLVALRGADTKLTAATPPAAAPADAPPPDQALTGPASAG